MNENGPRALAESVDAWLFDARCDGGANNFEIQVHPDFTEEEAESAAEKYGKAAGRLPKVLRSGIGTATGIRILSIHKGSHPWHASGWNGEICVYTERRSFAYHEETLVHEAAHVSLDDRVETDSKWLAAQEADGKYISTYAKNYPQREDVAESFLAYLAAWYLPSRISESWKTTILETIPNRIAYFDALLSADHMKPFTKASQSVVQEEVAADNPVSLSVSGSGAIAEGGAALTVTATLGTANATGAALAIPVRARAADTTATATDDYTLAGTISIPAGASSGTTALSVVDDKDDEPEETLVVELGSPLPSGLAAGTTDHVAITITDNDATTVELAVPDAEATKGDADTSRLVLTLNRGLVGDEVLAVPLAFSGAAAGTDFTLALDGSPKGVALAGGTVTFTGPEAGATATEAAVLLTALADGEATSVTVSLGTLSATAMGGGATGSRTGDGGIALVEPAPEITPEITIAAGSDVTEGDDAVFTITASPAPASPITVNIGLSETGDFGAAGPVTVTVSGASTAYTVTTADDEAGEPDGSVEATIQSGDGYTVGSASSDSVGILDDDPSGTVGELTTPAELAPTAVLVSLAAERTEVAEDNGEVKFTITLSRALAAGETVVVPLTVTGGKPNRHWNIRFRPKDNGPGVRRTGAGHDSAVTFTEGGRVATLVLIARPNYDTVERTIRIAFGTGDQAPVATGVEGGITLVGDALSVAITDDDAAVGPAFWVADEQASEGAGVMRFTVRLTMPATEVVRVRARTRNARPVSARAKRDYRPSRVDLRFRPGEMKKHVRVVLLNDSHDEGRETFELVLSNAEGAVIADKVAVGTIVNDDPLPGAYLARFGRTVAQQALDGIADRMTADRTPGMEGTLGGRTLIDTAATAVTGEDERIERNERTLSAFTDAAGEADMNGFPDATAEAEGNERTMTLREAFLGSRFNLTGGRDASGGSLSFWGRVSEGSFDGAERGDGTDITLDGTVTTGLLGADYAREDWLMGLALTHSSSEGGYSGIGEVATGRDDTSCTGTEETPCDGKIESSLTAAIPYASMQATDALKIWGAAGYGTGEVTLKTGAGESLTADTDWTMASVGLRGDLLEAPAEGGLSLAATSDALWTETSSEGTRDLASSKSNTTRLRLGLESSWKIMLENGGSLTPKLELGLRHDGGDAETGTGTEFGAGFSWHDPEQGISLDLSGRTLVSHEDDDLEDRGFSGSLSYDPTPSSGRGLSLQLRQETGGQSKGGLDALFAPTPLADRTGGGASTSRWTMEAAYGMPAWGGRYTGSPHAGLGVSGDARDWSVGWRVSPEGESVPDISFGVKATRRESGTEAPAHVLGFEFTARW